MSPKNFWSGSLAYKGTLEEQYFIRRKGEVISSKIDRLVAIYTSKLKWAEQANFLSQTHQIWEINLNSDRKRIGQKYLQKIY